MSQKQTVNSKGTASSKAKTQKNNDDVERVGHLISLLERVMRKAIAEALTPMNLTLQQYAALMILNNEEEISNAKLAKRSFMTPQSANEMVNALEAKRLIKREPDINHGRILHIRITTEGKRALRKADTAVLNIEKSMLENIATGDRSKFRDHLIGCLTTFGNSELMELPLKSSPKL